jgi:hypothetical protein
MPSQDWFEIVQRGGAITSPLLLAALIWMNRERIRLIGEVASKDAKLEGIAERTITLMTELKGLISARSVHK